jgi:hypothetical protein
MDADGLFGFYVVIFIYSLFFSIPSLAIYALVFILLKHYQANPVMAKMTLIALTVFLIVATFSTIGGSFLLPVTAHYSIAAIVIGILLKIGKRTTPDEYRDSIFEGEHPDKQTA